MKQWTSEVQYDDTTDTHFIILPDDLLAEVDLSGGDEVEWIDNGDGSWTLQRADYAEKRSNMGFNWYDEIIDWPLDLTPVDPDVFKEMASGLVKLTPVKAGWTAQFLLNK